VFGSQGIRGNENGWTNKFIGGVNRDDPMVQKREVRPLGKGGCNIDHKKHPKTKVSKSIVWGEPSGNS